MNKSVLISTRPQWCELIELNLKRLEVRKTRPREEPPFTCYLYETDRRRAVIGEFTCDRVYKWECKNRLEILESFPIWRASYMISVDDLEKTCLTYDDLWDYGNGKPLYGWHISDLKIYDKPKELSEFRKSGFMTEEEWLFNLYPNTHCHYEAWAKKFEITRPPQSWCYVNKLEE